MNACRVFLALLLITGSWADFARAETSGLWGAQGELWDAKGRLPDFSHAGYHRGESALPAARRGVSVKSFGAKGDGVADDTAAFLQALSQTEADVIEIPAGRYRITDILEIRRSGIVLRGDGTNTVLFFPKALEEIRPDPSATTAGRPTSNYSWSGGFIWFKGSFRSRVLAEVIAEANRGGNAVRVSTTSGLRAGQEIEIWLEDTMENSLARELYSDDPGDMANLKGRCHASLVCRIVKIDGNEITVDRPLRWNVRLEWQPRIRSFAPDVTGSGVENLTLEFPNTPYGGHFTESGFNAVAFSGVAHCWARRLKIVNPDSGIMVSGRFCTIADVVFETSRSPDASQCTGHHGVYFYGDDNLLTGFDLRMRFIHDVTVSGCAGNVIANGRGMDLCFDHHRHAPHENLFVNLDAGAGTRLWRSGGGAALGKHCGARGTFWNIRASQPQRYPPDAFGPPSINLVAVHTDQSSETNRQGRWFEAISPEAIVPKDIHAAQLERRLESEP